MRLGKSIMVVNNQCDKGDVGEKRCQAAHAPPTTPLCPTDLQHTVRYEFLNIVKKYLKRLLKARSAIAHEPKSLRFLKYT